MNDKFKVQTPYGEATYIVQWKPSIENDWAGCWHACPLWSRHERNEKGLCKIVDHSTLECAIVHKPEWPAMTQEAIYPGWPTSLLGPEPQTPQVPKTFEEAIEIVQREARDLMVRKNKDYGTKNITEFGEVGLVIRITDKINRLKHLVMGEQSRAVTGETVTDTWIDISNYSIIAVMIQRGWFELPYLDS